MEKLQKTSPAKSSKKVKNPARIVMTIISALFAAHSIIRLIVSSFRIPELHCDFINSKEYTTIKQLGVILCVFVLISFFACLPAWIRGKRYQTILIAVLLIILLAGLFFFAEMSDFFDCFYYL